MPHPHMFVILATSFLFFSFISYGEAEQPRLFWTDKDTGRIESSNLDGSGRTVVLSGLDDPRGIAVDQANHMIYWTSHVETGAIYSANCDGSNVQTFLSPLDEPADIALDPQNGHIYWAEEGANEIRRASLDKNVPPETLLSGLNRPYYLAIQPDAGFLYWSDFNSSIIHRATLNGQGEMDFITGQSRVRDIEVTDDYIYWCDRDSRQIRRRRLGGAGAGTILFSGAGDSLDRPHGLVIEPQSQTMFWTDTRTAEVNTATLDGSGSVDTLISTGLIGAWAIDILNPVAPNPYQIWLETNFSTEELSQSENENTLWGANADPDRDGRSNLLEYAQATQPRIPDHDAKSLQVKVVHNDEQSLFQFSFRMPKTDSNLTYTIESTKDLSVPIWQTGQLTEISERVSDLQNEGYEFITVEGPLDGFGFVRLKLFR